MSKKLNILVIHGYVQTAATVAGNTIPLKEKLESIAKLHYVEGPPRMDISPSRPWWILGPNLEYDNSASSRWDQTVKYWSKELSKNQYDGIIGLSQGSAMTALLISMLNNRAKIPAFNPEKDQPIKFAILCSGFISHKEPHGSLYDIPDHLPTLHTVDYNDFVVSADRTLELKDLFKDPELIVHREGHSVPVRDDYPDRMKEFIVRSCGLTTTSEHHAEGGEKEDEKREGKTKVTRSFWSFFRCGTSATD